MTPNGPQWRSRELVCAILVVMFAIAWFVLLQHFAFLNPWLYTDEDIALHVSNYLVTHNTLNTNWALVPEVSRVFPGDQFNFSSAILFYRYIGDALHPFIRHDAVATPLSIFELRLAAVACSTLAIPLFYLAFRRLVGPIIALVAVVLAFINYQTLTEGFQARPEAFILMAFAAGLLASVEAGCRTGAWRFIALLIAGVCLGVLVASKFSLIACAAPFGGVALLLHRPLKVRAFLASAALVAGLMLAGLLLGFALAAPYALLDPQAAMRGIQALLKQYGGSHLPYGKPHAPFIERLAYGLDQFISHIGWLGAIAAIAGLAVVAIQRKWAHFALIAAACLFCFYFLQSTVLFARNFSVMIPVICLSAAIGARASARLLADRLGAAWQPAALAVLVLAVLAQPVIASTRVGLSIERSAERGAEQNARKMVAALNWNAEIVEPGGWLTEPGFQQFVDVARGGGRKLYYFWRQNDPYSGEAIRRLVQDYGFREVLREPGDLFDFPQSMAQANFDQAFSLLLFDPMDTDKSAPAAPAFLRLGDVCVGRASQVQSSGTFEPNGLYPSVRPPTGVSGVGGSWLGGDSAMAQRVLNVAGPSGEWIIPVFTGPGKAGQTLSVTGANGAPLFNRMLATGEAWVGVRLNSDSGSFSVRAQDSGASWGEWMALAYPAPVMSCEAHGALRIDESRAVVAPARLAWPWQP